ncbi:MAG: hypothetical protein MR269_05480 [Clostridiales bacterium]|uniref:hypothetical protein n=1 Tax=Peptostreptococcus porci TaxID=2652282 RepID=UPI0029DDFD1C|nr:hypothetical protein [Peptostreptococcus porci]MCI5698461.1 hypothetical protein [Clostridiales bacterium]MDY4129527.1 hypothetical protein [Peptostreptococcus porci]
MTAKERLQEIRKLDMAIDYKLQVVDGLRKGNLPCQAMERLGSHGLGASDPTLSVVVKIDKLEREITAEVDELIDLKREVEKALRENLDSVEYSICYKRYFLYMKWEEIAQREHYTLRWIHKKHLSALKKISGKL